MTEEMLAWDALKRKEEWAFLEAAVCGCCCCRRRSSGSFAGGF